MSSTALKNVDFEKFGRLVLKKRYQRGLTQKELGEITGYTKSAVSKWEKGRPIHAPAYRKVCAALGIPEVSPLSAAESAPKGSQNAKTDAPEATVSLDELARLMGMARPGAEPRQNAAQPSGAQGGKSLDPDRLDELVARLAAQAAAIKRTMQANPEKREECEQDVRALRMAISLMSTMALSL